MKRGGGAGAQAPSTSARPQTVVARPSSQQFIGSSGHSPSGRRQVPGSGNAGGAKGTVVCHAAGAAAINPIFGGLPDEELPKIKPLWPSNGMPQEQPLEWQRERDRERERELEKKPRLVRVRLSVHYRVHSRQMLCIGGSQIPFGWSFLSIAKVPMTWTQGDVWQAEVVLPAGQRIEYKYVILEEQDWTKLENEDAEGLVEVTYRSGAEPGAPPDVTAITKQMAIVAWQPGPNRIVQVPTEEELSAVQPGEAVKRVPARAPARSAFDAPPKEDPFAGTWEALRVSEEGEPRLDRGDVWGWSAPTTNSRPPSLKNLRFDN
ncbi:MAG: hypothetical protein J3K34DRAFT_214549 [Monoraphidium minutum]|nr:MAG: hypothetical protein J3K34DRAFT_214549 [Monoraphidium minutum]